jgi:lysophospholipase L1-like esterase
MASSASAAAPKRKARPKPAPASIRGERALDAFFERLAALERGEVPEVRVLWLGDSHVAADFLTGHVRKLLQARFGDAGPGLVMPGAPWRYFRHDRARSRGDGGFETSGLGREAVDPLVGLWGVSLVPRGEGSASLDAVFAEAEVAALASSGEGCLAVSLDGVTAFAGDVGEAVDGGPTPCARVEGAVLKDGGVVAFVEARGDEEAPRQLVVRDACGGAVRVLGADLRSGRPGILVDSVGVNGAEIGWLGRPDRELRRVLLERLDPALVVASFGTNDMGRGDLVPEDFEAEATGLLTALREDAPDAALLVTGPIDRASRSRRVSRLLAVNEPAVIRALGAASAAVGGAFVDQRALMGGDGAIRAWARRGRAARDLVHLSRPGYETLAESIVGLLLRAYDARGGAGPAPRP